MKMIVRPVLIMIGAMKSGLVGFLRIHGIKNWDTLENRRASQRVLRGAWVLLKQGWERD